MKNVKTNNVNLYCNSSPKIFKNLFFNRGLWFEDKFCLFYCEICGILLFAGDTFHRNLAVRAVPAAGYFSFHALTINPKICNIILRNAYLYKTDSYGLPT